MNTYAQLKPEPKNKFDPQAIEVLARGEFFGHMGYIAKEQTDAVRALARYAGCDLKDIAVQIVCTGDVGFKSVRLASSPPHNGRCDVRKRLSASERHDRKRAEHKRYYAQTPSSTSGEGGRMTRISWFSSKGFPIASFHQSSSAR